MMSIHHKINLPDFIKHNWRKADVFIKRTVNILPARGQLILRRKKSAIKFMIAIQTTDDLIHANGMHAAIDRSTNMQTLFDLIVGKQGGRLAGDGGEGTVQKSFEARPAEIGAYTGSQFIRHVQSQLLYKGICS